MSYHASSFLDFFFLARTFKISSFDEGRAVRTLEWRSTTRSETREIAPIRQKPAVAGEGSTWVDGMLHRGPRRAGFRRVSSPTRPLSEYLFLNWANKAFAPGNNAASDISARGSVCFPWNVTDSWRTETILEYRFQNFRKSLGAYMWRLRM